MIQIYSVMAEFERDQIAARTKAALAAAKARGVKLGVAGRENLNRDVQRRKSTAEAFAIRLAGIITGFRVRRLTQRAMVAELNQLGIRTATGKAWSLIQLQRTLARLAALATTKQAPCSKAETSRPDEAPASAVYYLPFFGGGAGRLIVSTTW